MILTRRCLVPLLLMCGCTIAQSAVAASPQVSDEGKLFSPQAVEKASLKIQEIARESGKEVRIDTVAAIPADHQARFRTLGKKDFFIEWARERAQAAKVKGIYVLVCKDPGHLEILVDRATRRTAFTLADRNRLVKEVVARLNQDRFAPAILMGPGAVAYLLAVLNQNRFDEALLAMLDSIQAALRTNLGLKTPAVEASSPATTPAGKPIVEAPDK